MSSIVKAEEPEFLGYGLNSIRITIPILPEEDIDHWSVISKINDNEIGEVLECSLFFLERTSTEQHALIQIRFFNVQTIPSYARVQATITFNSGRQIQYLSNELQVRLQKAPSPIVFERQPRVRSIREKVIQRIINNAKRIESLSYEIDLFEGQELNHRSSESIIPREKFGFDCFGGISYFDDYYYSSPGCSGKKFFFLKRKNSPEGRPFPKELSLFERATISLYDDDSTLLFQCPGRIVSVLNTEVCVFVSAESSPGISLYAIASQFPTAYRIVLTVFDGIVIDSEEEIEEKRVSILSVVMDNLATLSGSIHRAVLHGRPKFGKEDWRILSTSTLRRNILQVNETRYQENGIIPEQIRISDIGEFRNQTHFDKFFEVIEGPPGGYSFSYEQDIFFNSLTITPGYSSSPTPTSPVICKIQSKDEFVLFEKQEIEFEVSAFLIQAEVSFYFSKTINNSGNAYQEDILIKRIATEGTAPMNIRRLIQPLLFMEDTAHRKLKIEAKLYSPESKVVLAGIQAIQTEFSKSAYFEFPVSLPYRNEVIELKLEFLNPYSQSNEVEYALGTALVQGENFYVSGDDSFIDGRVFIGTDYLQNIEIGSEGRGSYIKSNPYYGREEFQLSRGTSPSGYLLWSKNTVPTWLAFPPKKKISFVSGEICSFSFQDNNEGIVAFYFNHGSEPPLSMSSSDQLVLTSRNPLTIRAHSKIEFTGNMKISGVTGTQTPYLFVKEGKILFEQGALTLFPKPGESTSMFETTDEFVLNINPQTPSPGTMSMIKILLKNKNSHEFSLVPKSPPITNGDKIRVQFYTDSLLVAALRRPANKEPLTITRKRTPLSVYCSLNKALKKNDSLFFLDYDEYFNSIKEELRASRKMTSMPNYSVDILNHLQHDKLATISSGSSVLRAINDFPQDSPPSVIPTISTDIMNTWFYKISKRDGGNHAKTLFSDNKSLLSLSWNSDLFEDENDVQSSWYRIDKETITNIFLTKNPASLFFYYPAQLFAVSVEFDAIELKPRIFVEGLSLEGFLEEDLELQGTLKFNSMDSNKNYVSQYDVQKYQVPSSTEVIEVIYIDWNPFQTKNPLLRGEYQRFYFKKNTYVKIHEFTGFVYSRKIVLSSFFPSITKRMSSGSNHYFVPADMNSEFKKHPLYELSMPSELSKIAVQYSIRHSEKQFKLEFYHNTQYTVNEALIPPTSPLFSLVKRTSDTGSIT